MYYVVLVEVDVCGGQGFFVFSFYLGELGCVGVMKFESVNLCKVIVQGED